MQNLVNRCHGDAKEAGWWNDIPAMGAYDPDGECSSCDFNHYGACSSIYGEECESNRLVFLADKIDLIAGEGAEAVEALRGNRRADWGNLLSDLWDNGDPTWISFFKSDIKDTFEDEVADIAIRTMDLMGFYGWKYRDVDSTKSRGLWSLSIKGLLRELRYESLGIAKHPSTTTVDHFIYFLQICKQIADHEGFDLKWHILAKLEYNKSRGQKHGKQF